GALRLTAGIPASSLVLRYDFLAALVVPAPGGDDFIREGARVGRLGGQPVTAEGKLILRLAADFVFQSEVLSSESHVHGCRAVAIEEQGARIIAGLHRNVLHVFDTARDLHVLAIGRDALSRLVDRLQAGAAIAVHRGASDFNGKARDECGHARDVPSLLTLLL